MNILFVAQRVPYPANKGEKIRTFNQIKYLADLGHKVTVLTPTESAQDIEYCHQLSALPNITCQYQELKSKWYRMVSGLLQNEALSIANFYSPKLQKDIDTTLKIDNFDCIICTSSAVAKYIFKTEELNKLKKKPLLFMDFMDLDSDKWQQYSDSSGFPMSMVYQRECNLLGKYERKIQQSFDACFFIADAEVKLFKQGATDANNVFTLGNGMSTEEFYPADKSPNNADPVFLFTGVMDYKPNIDAVLWFIETVWQDILSQYPKARFIVAGMNPVSSIEALKGTKGIEVTGFVDEILPYYHQADYFIAPFRLARGVQNKVLQAFSCGLPVISTPMGAEGIDCEADKDILLASKADEFLKAINLLETDTKFKKDIIKNALNLIINHYSWQGKLKILSDKLTSSVIKS